MDVYVAVWEGDFNSEVQVYDKAEAAEAWRQEIAKEYWEEVADEFEPYDETEPARMADIYFDRKQDRLPGEYFSVYKRALQA